MSSDEESEKRFRRTASDTYPISARVTLPMLTAIDLLIETGKYLRISDYLRDLVRKDFEERGIEIK